MRIAIAQLDLKIGAFDDNFEKIRRAVADARAEAADLVVLSELATVGYPLADLVERSDLVDRNLEQLERIAGLTDDDLNALVAVTCAVNSGVTAATARVAFGMIEEENAAECGDVCSASPQ